MNKLKSWMAESPGTKWALVDYNDRDVEFCMTSELMQMIGIEIDGLPRPPQNARELYAVLRIADHVRINDYDAEGDEIKLVIYDKECSLLPISPETTAIVISGDRHWTGVGTAVSFEELVPYDEPPDWIGADSFNGFDNIRLTILELNDQNRLHGVIGDNRHDKISVVNGDYELTVVRVK